MGADFYSYAIIGCSINKKKLYTTKTVKTFEHNYTEESGILFDPKTGDRLWQTLEVPIPEFDECNMTLCGYTVVQDKSYNGDYYVAMYIAEHDSNPVEIPDNLRPDIDKFIETLSKIGQYDEDSFGLHALLYVSY